jgi:hypothetical protein
MNAETERAILDAVQFMNSARLTSEGTIEQLASFDRFVYLEITNGQPWSPASVAETILTNPRFRAFLTARVNETIERLFTTGWVVEAGGEAGGE